LPAERVVEGPALRFAHLRHNGSSDESDEDADSCVLVAVPLEMGAASELLSKVLGALGEQDTMPVRIKPHPMMDPAVLLRHCGLAELPAHCSFVQGGMAEWLVRARVVVSAGSAVLLEALTAGVPAVTVGRESALNLNPLAWYTDLGSIRHSPDEILREVRRLWSLSEAERAAYRRRGAEILRTSFNEVTEETMGAFVRGLVDGADLVGTEASEPAATGDRSGGREKARSDERVMSTVS
jgi:hypothetical protein